MSTKKRSLGIVLLTVICGMIILSSANAFGGDGNVDGIGGVDLKDVIMSLQISDGLTPNGSIVLRFWFFMAYFLPICYTSVRISEFRRI